MTPREKTIKSLMGAMYHLPKFGLLCIVTVLASIVGWAYDLQHMWIPITTAALGLIVSIAMYIIDRIRAEGEVDRRIEQYEPDVGK